MSLNDFADIRRRIFVQLLVLAKYDNRDVDVAEHTELMRLLEQASFALQERPVSLSARRH